MGSGIAQVAAAAGHKVRLLDARPGAAEAARAQIASRLDAAVSKGRLSRPDAQGVVSRIEPVNDVAALAGAALVVEAIVEDLATKRALFGELEATVDEAAILASNTSSLSITALGAGLRRPERLVGMHFFNPAPVMELVEVVRGLATDPATARVVEATATAWGKTAVHCRSTPGFIVNRIARPFYGEALRLIAERVADAATIDAVMRECGGFRMGPLELTDLIGQDVNDAVTRSVYHAYDEEPRYRPSVVQRELIEAGRLGRKSGHGFYRYGPDAPRPAPATEPLRSAPARIRVEGDLGPLEALAERMAGGGIGIERAGGTGRIVVRDLTLRLCDGRSATARAAELGERLVHLDLALDFARASRLCIAPSLQAGHELEPVIGALQATGCTVSRVRDSAAMIVMRTVAMLANEAVEAARQDVATPAAIDLAMVKGVNYPRGPLDWASDLGLAQLLRVLDGLTGTYGEDRYRASPLLRDLVLAHRSHVAVA
jgi:3-hydroxybutyryl-CoA dehydrogenase